MRRLIIASCTLVVLLPSTALAERLLFGPKTYVRTTSAPDVHRDQFAFASRHREARLTVTNGDEAGRGRVSSARILLNGREVFGPSDFRQQVDALDMFLPLEDQNTLEVELSGKPGGRVTVQVSQPFFEEHPGWRMAELAVSALTVAPERAGVGEVVTLSAVLDSSGGSDAPAATVSFRVDGTEVASIPVDAIPPRGRKIVEAHWTAAGPGHHVVAVEAQVPDGTFDGSVWNNVRFALARVAGETDPPLEVEFGDIDFGLLQINPGTPFTVPLQIRNPGFVPLADAQLRVLLDGEDLLLGGVEGSSGDDISWPWPWITLDAGQSADLAIPIAGATRGEHSFQVLVYSAPFEVTFEKTWSFVVADVTVLTTLPLEDKWISVGPSILDNGWTGRMRAIAFDPSDPDVIYGGGLATDMSIPAATGVWRSANGGATWTPIGDKLPQLMVGSLAVDPKDPDIVYAGTPDGIMKTTDGGVTWWIFAGPAVMKHVGRLLVRSAGNGGVLVYAGTSTGVMRYSSSNRYATSSTGSDWDVIRKGDVGELVAHPTNPSILYAYIRTDGVYRTTVGEIAAPETPAGGHDWIKLTTGLPDVSTKTVTLDVHKLYPGLVYAGIIQPVTGTSFGIYRSADGGDSWSVVKTWPTEALDETKSCPIYNPYLRVVPRAATDTVLPEIVYFGGNCLYQYVNHWVLASGVKAVPQGGTYMVSGYYVKQQAGVDMKALEFLPAFPEQVYYSLGDQGVFRCLIETTPKKPVLPGKSYGESGDLCFARNKDLRVTEFYDIDVSRTDPNRIIGGTQDTGTVLFSGDPGLTWKMVLDGDGLYSLFSPGDDQILYAQHQALADTKRSPDGGKTWPVQVLSGSGLPTGYGLGGGFITMRPWHQEGVDAVLATPGGLNLAWAINFLQVPPPGVLLPSPVPLNGVSGNVSRLAFGERPAAWYVATTNGRIYRATKAELEGLFPSFTEIFAHPAGLPIRGLAVSAAADDLLFATFNGPGLSQGRIYGIWRDASSPALWRAEDLTAGFPTDLTPLSVVADPHEAYRVYVGTEKGVRRRPPAVGNVNQWKPYNDGLPLTSVVDLVAAPDGSIVAATKGRGAWRVNPGP
jgi:hypothetical protein